MKPDDVDRVLFEQHWIHSRHIETERMWIMGIWLGFTAFVYKESWLATKPELTLPALRVMSSVHLVVTVAVLLIILKLQLAYDVHVTRFTIMSRGASRKHSWWQSYRTDTGMWIPQVGLVCSILLCAAIFLDVGLVACPCIQSRFPTEFENWLLALPIAICAFCYFQLVIRLSNTRLEGNKAGEKKMRNFGYLGLLTLLGLLGIFTGNTGFYGFCGFLGFFAFFLIRNGKEQ